MAYSRCATDDATDAETEEEFALDLNEDEPLFLRGVSTRSTGAVSPVKVVKNPDGSMQRAAMTASALAKERRELQQHQQRTVLEAIPKDLSRPWEDPLADSSERALAQELSRPNGHGRQLYPGPMGARASPHRRGCRLSRRRRCRLSRQNLILARRRDNPNLPFACRWLRSRRSTLFARRSGRRTRLSPRRRSRL